jgi:hypothetical protein
MALNATWLHIATSLTMGARITVLMTPILTQLPEAYQESATGLKND